MEALGLTQTAVRLRLCGSSVGPDYVASLHAAAERLGVQDRLAIDNRWIDEDEKVAILETALAAAYVAPDEDSYGYPTLEAAHARRASITLSDAGGVLEFVVDGQNGLVAEPEPAGLAAAFDRLYCDRAFAKRLGDAAANQVEALGINWEAVVAKLLA